MDHSEPTRLSLLSRLCNSQDGTAWDQFVEVYTPFVYQFLRRRGLQEADAADVTQDVLRTVFHSVDKFDHGGRHGAFRSWLVSITRSRLCDFLAKGARQVAGGGGTTMVQQLEEQPSPEEEEELIRRDYQRHLFQWAAKTVRQEFQSSTWQAFWLTYVDGQGNQQVAESLGISIDAVYIARSRVLARLKRRVQEIEG